MSDEIDRLNDRMNGIFLEIQKLREREDERAKRDWAESEDEARAKRRLQEHVSMEAAAQGSVSYYPYRNVPQSNEQNNATQNLPMGLHENPILPLCPGCGRDMTTCNIRYHSAKFGLFCSFGCFEAFSGAQVKQSHDTWGHKFSDPTVIDEREPPIDDELVRLRAKLSNCECQLRYIENWVMNPESVRPGASVSQSWILSVLDQAKKLWPVG